MSFIGMHWVKDTNRRFLKERIDQERHESRENKVS